MQQTEFTRQQAIELLFEAIQLGRERSDPQSIIRAVTELNRMHDYHAPEVRKVSIDVDAKKFAKQLEMMSDQDLQRMAAG